MAEHWPGNQRNRILVVLCCCRMAVLPYARHLPSLFFISSVRSLAKARSFPLPGMQPLQFSHEGFIPPFIPLQEVS